MADANQDREAIPIDSLDIRSLKQVSDSLEQTLQVLKTRINPVTKEKEE